MKPRDLIGWRTKLKLSKADFCKISKTPRNTLYNWEKPEWHKQNRRIPGTIHVLTSLIDYLIIHSPDVIMNWIEDNRNK